MPWRRLIEGVAVYAGIMVVVFALLFRGEAGLWPIIGGLLASGPLYLGLGYVLAKFGYERKTLGRAAHAPCVRSGARRRRAGEPAHGRRRPGARRRGRNRPAAKSRRR